MVEMIESNCARCGGSEQHAPGCKHGIGNMLVLEQRSEVLHKITYDFDRRNKHWWGKFLMWLLRVTT